ncbi:MAG: serine/threonine-protein kinase [Myxococcota bacterium]
MSAPPPDSIHPNYDLNRLTEEGADRQVGRCELFVALAQGGMATVYLGRWIGAGGFEKTVAVKSLHRMYASDPDFVSMFLDEARVVARIQHPNVMPIIDLVDDHGELFIVMEYVHGVTLAQLTRQLRRDKRPMPIGIALRVITGVLGGLHAAHEAKGAGGHNLDLIHRDVTPDNVMIGTDGYARLIDFGIATALSGQPDDDESIKGKPAYLAPEQLLSLPLDRRTDVYSAAVVLWQALTGRKLVRGKNIGDVTMTVLAEERPPPSKYRKEVDTMLDEVVLRGMAMDMNHRYASAEAMAEALEDTQRVASHREVGRFIAEVCARRLSKMEELKQAVEAAPVQKRDSSEFRAPLSVHRAEVQFEVPRLSVVDDGSFSEVDLSVREAPPADAQPRDTLRPLPRFAFDGKVAAAIVILFLVLVAAAIATGC